MKISGTVIALNEEANIGRALKSLAICDEVVVVDSGSRDRTCEIARSLGARVVESEWRGYARQKNFASAEAANDWILSIDADEELSPALQSEVAGLKNSAPAYEGYSMPRLARYLGRWIRHSGWYPDRKVRLFDRRRARWRGEYVHESVGVDGRVGELRGDLLHYTCDSFGDHLRTMDRYTTLAAEEMVARGERVGWGRLLLNPPWTFARTLVLRRAYLDGVQGVAIAYMAAQYNFLKYAKARLAGRS
jgi:glycosyltransferase involved in cell wall biosynthesis